MSLFSKVCSLKSFPLSPPSSNATESTEKFLFGSSSCDNESAATIALNENNIKLTYSLIKNVKLIIGFQIYQFLNVEKV
jgi:hypothetical protein